jgi:hypothetical protein
MVWPCCCDWANWRRIYEHPPQACSRILGMDIHRASAWAQVLSFPFAAYCAYGTYVNLHHPTDAEAGQASSVIFNPTMLYVGFGALGACLLIVVIVRIVEFASRNKRHPIISEVGEVAALRKAHNDEMGAKMERTGELNALKRQYSDLQSELSGCRRELTEAQSGASARDQIIEGNKRDIGYLQELLEEERGAHNATLGRLVLLENQPPPKAIPPNVIIQYWNEGSRGIDEYFELTNHGPGLIQKITIGPLLISKRKNQETHQMSVAITPFTGIGILQERRPEHVGFAASVGGHGTNVATWIRNYMEEGFETSCNMILAYEDLNSAMFTRNFALWIDTANRISMEADGPIMKGGR